MENDPNLSRHVQFLAQQISRLTNILEHKSDATTQLMFGQHASPASPTADQLLSLFQTQEDTLENIELSLRDLVQIFKSRDLPSK